MLTMPAGHSQRELDLARAVARHIGSEELHVFWSRVPQAPRARRAGRWPVVRALAALNRLLDRL
jgi:hypothetical protein